MGLFRNKKFNRANLDFGEVLMDSRNISGFDKQQFEGRIEQPISRLSLYGIGAFFLVIGVIFIWQLNILQIKKGEAYAVLSVGNSLDEEIIFADRGIIFDRNGIELAWNEELETEERDFPHRGYIDEPGYSILLGYVQYPQKDRAGFYWNTDFSGMAGAEKRHNAVLNGENGSKIVEVDAIGEISLENVINTPTHGTNLILSVDSRLQTQMTKSMIALAEENGYQGGSAAIMDIDTGELLVATSFPEYNSEILSDGEDRDAINAFINDSTKPFLNRLVGGLYSPGSTVKPFIAFGALEEGLITPGTIIKSTGRIEIPNPYVEDQYTYFRDWKDGGHGWVDVADSIAESVNTFFYAIGGGYEEQKGLGISGIEKYIRLFGIGDETGVDILGEIGGVVPNPEWKKKVFDNDAWRLGDTYNTSIGQYGFQATPIQMLRATAAIANDGILVTPNLVPDVLLRVEPIKGEFNIENFEEIREGMRQVVTEGTGRVMNVPFVDVAAKTGTAQVGVENKFINSWSLGFFPYEEPQYAYVMVMERGPEEDAEESASYAMREFLDWMNENTPEYFEE